MHEEHGKNEGAESDANNDSDEKVAFSWFAKLREHLTHVSTSTLLGIVVATLLTPLLNILEGPYQYWWVALGLCIGTGALIFSPLVDRSRRFKIILVAAVNLALVLVAWVGISTLVTKQLIDRRASEEAAKAENNRIASEFAAVRVEIGDLKRAAVSRSLSAEERRRILEAVKAFRGQPVEVLCLTWDAERSRYAQDFVQVLSEAGWQLPTPPISNSTFPIDFDNVTVMINPAETEATVPPGAVALYKVLCELNIVKNHTLLPGSASVAKGRIQIRIGAKPV